MEFDAPVAQVTDRLTIAPGPFPRTVFQKLKPSITARSKSTQMILQKALPRRPKRAALSTVTVGGALVQFLERVGKLSAGPDRPNLEPPLLPCETGISELVAGWKKLTIELF